MSLLDTLQLIGQCVVLVGIVWVACAIATWMDNKGRAKRVVVIECDEPYSDPNEGLTDLEAHLRP